MDEVRTSVTQFNSFREFLIFIIENYSLKEFSEFRLYPDIVQDDVSGELLEDISKDFEYLQNFSFLYHNDKFGNSIISENYRFVDRLISQLPRHTPFYSIFRQLFFYIQAEDSQKLNSILNAVEVLYDLKKYWRSLNFMGVLVDENDDTGTIHANCKNLRRGLTNFIDRNENSEMFEVFVNQIELENVPRTESEWAAITQFIFAALTLYYLESSRLNNSSEIHDGIIFSAADFEPITDSIYFAGMMNKYIDRNAIKAKIEKITTQKGMDDRGDIISNFWKTLKTEFNTQYPNPKKKGDKLKFIKNNIQRARDLAIEYKLTGDRYKFHYSTPEQKKKTLASMQRDIKSNNN